MSALPYAIRGRLLLMALGAACSVGCRTTPATRVPAGSMVWPLPPASPRLSYVQSLREPADWGIRPGFWRTALAWVFGGARDDRFVKPAGVAFDEHGNLCVADPGAQAVGFFDRQRKTFQRWDHLKSLRFLQPVSVAKRGNTVFVADSGLGRVLAFDLAGKLQFQISAGLQRPVAVAIASNTLLVADSTAHCVRVFDLAGHPLRQIGRRGTGPGEFNFPTHLAVDGMGRIYVTDAMNSRIQVFDGAGRPLRCISSLGDNAGHFSRPKGVAVDQCGHIYVADALFDNVQVFDLDGRFLLNFGSSGSEPGEFWMPAGIAIGPDNEIAVADSYNCRIEIFRYMGGE